MNEKPNPFAPLLAGVRRINPYSQETSALLYEDEVLAALAAAVPDDLAEAAGDLLPDLQRAADDGDIDCKEAVRLITALLARIAAMEAEVTATDDLMAADSGRIAALETALAAERAKVAKLVEAVAVRLTVAERKALLRIKTDGPHRHEAMSQSVFDRLKRDGLIMIDGGISSAVTENASGTGVHWTIVPTELGEVVTAAITEATET